MFGLNPRIDGGSRGLGVLDVEQDEGDIVLLALTAGKAGPTCDFREEGVGELLDAERVMLFHEAAEAFRAVKFFGRTRGFRNAVGVENIAIAWFERKLPAFVGGFFEYAENDAIF